MAEPLYQSFMHAMYLYIGLCFSLYQRTLLFATLCLR